ncbi:MAG: glycosyltransferase family 2 protein [Verrucomicrobiota bacterium]
MKSSLSISLVISTYNQPMALAKVLAGLQRQTRWPTEVLFADDGSGEPTRTIIAQFAATAPVPVRHVWHTHDGFRKTVILNQTLAAAAGDYLIFTDADCVPHPRFVADHAALAETGFWVQGRRCFVREKFVHKFTADKIPALGWMLTGKITGVCKGVRWPLALISRDRKQRGIIGCNMAFWRDDLLAVNGFDEDYTGWGTGEDSDVATRVYHLGRRRKFVYGRAITFHLNHPQASRSHHAASRARLAETLAGGKIRCEHGLNRHFGQDISRQANNPLI